MPKFRYTAKNQLGKTIHAEADAFDKNSLVQQLQSQGLFVIAIEEHFIRSSADIELPALVLPRAS